MNSQIINIIHRPYTILNGETMVHRNEKKYGPPVCPKTGDCPIMESLVDVNMWMSSTHINNPTNSPVEARTIVRELIMLGLNYSDIRVSIECIPNTELLYGGNF